MELSPTRFLKIEGTSVTASVNTAAEAKMAVKEIRQKKRELAHLKKGLVRQKKSIEKRSGGTRRRRPQQNPGLFARVGNVIAKVAGMAGAYGTASAVMDLPRIEQACAETDEILHNLETVLIQIEGKLLRLS